MKTPRQILLHRHQSVQPKLDSIRNEVLATLVPLPAPRHALHAVVEIWEWLTGFRWHLAGLSGAWLMIALLSLNQDAPALATIDARKIPSPQQLLASIRENRRQLFELLEGPVRETMPSPQGALPRRRGELETNHLLA